MNTSVSLCSQSIWLPVQIELHSGSLISWCRLTCLSLDCGGNELMSTGDLDSSGNGFGMAGTEEENGSPPFALETDERTHQHQNEKLTITISKLHINGKYRIRLINPLKKKKLNWIMLLWQSVKPYSSLDVSNNVWHNDSVITLCRSGLNSSLPHWGHF